MSDDDLETRGFTPTPPLPGPGLVFAHCRVDTVRRELRVHGRAVAAQPLVYALLLYLLRHPGRVIPKDELLRHVWRSPVVTDSAVTRAMTKLRRLLDDTGGTPLITTVHTVGYRLNATVRVEQSSGPAQSDRQVAGSGPREWRPMSVAKAAHAVVGSPLADARVETAVHALLPMQDAVDGSDRVVQDALVDWLHRLLRRYASGPWLPMPTVRAWSAGSAGARDLAEACRALRAECAVRCIVTFEHHRVLLDATWGDNESTAQRRRFAGVGLESVTRQLAHVLTGHPMSDADAESTEATEDAALVFWQQQGLRCFALEQQGLDEQAQALVERCLARLRPNPLLEVLLVRVLHRRLQLGRARETALAALDTARDDDDTSSLVALHTELADIALKEFDLEQADRHCGLAEQAAAADVSAQEALPQILQIHATVHNLRGEPLAALPLLERAQEIALASGNVPAQLRALTTLGKQWLELGRSGDAEGAFRQVIAGAAEADLPSLEAEGYLGMSELYTLRRALALAVDTSRKASTLSRLAGDARCRQLARSRELMALTDAGLLEAAAARLADAGDAHADEALTFAAVRLAWRQGDHVGATARWQQLYDDCRARQSPPVWTIGAGLLRRRLALGQIEAARLLQKQLARDPDNIRRIGNAAVLAHAEGRLATSIAHLQEIWAAQGVRTPAGQDAALNLAWLLIESGHLGDIPGLERDVQTVSTEYEPARIVQHVVRSRWGSMPASVPTWRSLVDNTPGLARRHFWLGHAAAMPRPHTPAGRTLPELLCEACL